MIMTYCVTEQYHITIILLFPTRLLSVYPSHKLPFDIDIDLISTS